jgi:hypothetical protein
MNKQTERTIKSYAAIVLGSVKSKKKAAAARINGKLGGRKKAKVAAIAAVSAQALADKAAMEGAS